LDDRGVIAGLGQYAVALPAALLAVLVLGAMQKLESRMDGTAANSSD